MRRSEFHRAVTDEFGGRAAHVVSDLALPGVGNLTAEDAIEAGVPPRDVWLALCDEADVPANRRYGAGRQDPHGR